MGNFGDFALPHISLNHLPPQLQAKYVFKKKQKTQNKITTHEQTAKES